MEWFDFAIYGALGVLVTPIFFPSQHGATVLVAAFAVYATAFLVRPFGALAFGVLPGYATLGILAPCALLLLRATQGLAAGGELGLAAVCHLLCGSGPRLPSAS